MLYYLEVLTVLKKLICEFINKERTNKMSNKFTLKLKYNIILR